MKNLRLLPLVILALAIVRNPAMAKSEFNLITVAGPDWYGEIELADSEIPNALVYGGFFNPELQVSAPKELGRGYLITRGYDEGGERYMFDRLLYFPGQPGYVYYLEIIDHVQTEPDHLRRSSCFCDSIFLFAITIRFSSGRRPWERW